MTSMWQASWFHSCWFCKRS